MLLALALLAQITNPGAITYKASGGNTRLLSAKLGDVVSVKDFGAKGDGVTDDTAAIQSAINSARGRVILLPRPAVKYLISSGPLVITPIVSGTTQLPFIMVGEGFDGNGGNGGTLLSCPGASDCIQIDNSSTGQNSNNVILLQDFGIYGDGANAAGGNGITAKVVSGLVLKRLWVQGMRGNGISLTQCYGALIDTVTVLRNRLNGVYLYKQNNQVTIRSSKLLNNGRIYSQQLANLYVDGAATFENLGLRVENTDLSYAGGSDFQTFKTSDGTISSIVVSGTTATVTTSTPHNLAVNNYITFSGSASSSGFDTAYPIAVASVPSATTFTFSTAVAPGTYNNSTDPYLTLRSSAFGAYVAHTRGFVIDTAYIEDTADSLIYFANNNNSATIHGGYMQGQWVLVDAAVNSEIGGVDFAPGQRNGSGKVGVLNNSTTFDVMRSNTFETNTQLVASAPQRRNGGYQGSITLAAGTGTATVVSGSTCTCTDTTANASVKCSVSGTTLTATGTGTDVISYLCF